MMNYLLVAISYLSVQLVLVSPAHQQSDCIDTKRKLRCVLRENCPYKRIVHGKQCPSERVCCRKHKSNPYLPLRIIPNQNTTISTPIEFKNNDKKENEKIVFPSELDNLKYETIVQPFYQVINDTEVEMLDYQRESKSEDFVNFLFPKEGQNSERKSVKACRRYARISMEYSHFMPLLPQATPRKITMDKCEPQVNPLIVGGVNATIKDYPHMAALGYNKSNKIDYLCGGTLISENFVLTAGHCANTRWGPPVVAHLGSAELYSQEATRATIKQVITHPNYKPPSCYDDIALLRLEKSVKLTMFLRPACLPTYQSEEQATSNTLVATGWGKTGFGRESSVTLLKVALKAIKNQECGKYYEGDVQALRRGITSNMICASGHMNVEHDTCQGDSGGPLQAPLVHYECMSQILAITSFGKSCGAGIPAVYTRVLSYLSWIEDTVW